MKPKPNNSAPKIVDPVFQQFGEPFLASGKTIKINSRAVAIKCATRHMINYDTKAKRHQRFDRNRGLWVMVDEVQVARALDDLLVELGNACGHQNMVKEITAAKLAALCKMMRPHDVRVESEDTAGLVHVVNGIVSLGGSKPKLLPHDPKYPFRATSGINYDPRAACHRFLKQFLGSALDKADIALFQKYCGSMLLGPNTCHGILVIRGTPGGGKSTLVTMVEKAIGEMLVAHLRTAHLGGRFETSAFLGKRLLVGKDVPGDTLAVSGARMLKSLVGGDLMQAEIKFNPEKQAARGDYHVIIVSNNNLRVALDGDEDAWRRRLLVVDFKNPKPSKPIPHLAEKLFAAEASGILNWMIEGAFAFRAEMEKYGHLQLTEEQQKRVETLLQDSDNVAQFVKQSVVPESGRDVTSEELLVCYYKNCERQQWTPVGIHAFQKRVPEILGQMFKTTRRNDILREGRAARGFKNVTLA